MGAPRYVVAISGDIFPGPSVREDYERGGDPWTWRFRALLSKAEAEWIMKNRPVLHYTYSMQQESFRNAGFEVLDTRVQVAPDTLVIGIGTRDRYDIFPEGTQLAQYDTAEEWRASEHYAERLNGR